MQAATLLLVVCALVGSCYADGLPIKNCDNANSKHLMAWIISSCKTALTIIISV